MKLKTGIVLAAAALVAGPSFAATSLAVNGGAALEGSYGLAVSFDGAGGNAYVQDNSPASESEYWAVVLLNDNNMTLPPGSSFQFLRAFVDDAASATAFRINILPPAPGQANNKVYVLPTLDGGSFHPLGSETFINTAVQPDRDKFIFEWKASTAPGADNGHLKTYRDGALRKTVGSLNNDTIRVGMVRMGGFGNTSSVTAGSVLKLDGFESYRSAITPTP